MTGKYDDRLKDYVDVLPPRFWAKIDVADCWEWTASGSSGYGLAWIDGRLQRPHRVMYETFVGPIGPGLELDHLCRNRACVNPDHLEPVTRAENIRRGYRRRVLSCPQGHRYDEANTKVYKGRRYCRACHAVYSRHWRMEHRS